MRDGKWLTAVYTELGKYKRGLVTNVEVGFALIMFIVLSLNTKVRLLSDGVDYIKEHCTDEDLMREVLDPDKQGKFWVPAELCELGTDDLWRALGACESKQESALKTYSNRFNMAVDHLSEDLRDIYREQRSIRKILEGRE